MRVGVVWDPSSPGCVYRAYEPVDALGRRGHEVVIPDLTGWLPGRRLTSCDVVHVYRLHDDRTKRLMADLTRAGIAVTWDNDDDFSALPAAHLTYRKMAGDAGEKLHAAMMEAAALADAVSTTTEPLAESFRAAGIEHVTVIENSLEHAMVAMRKNVRRRERREHEGVVIGWMAALEHRSDADELGLVDVLRRVMEKHPEVRVETIGVDLDLGERYRCHGILPMRSIDRYVLDWDIAIAPLTDTPFNRARSDIKLKEYASCRVAWLASPVTPYAGLGEQQGGRLVPDDQWFEALDELVSNGRLRRRLARRGRAWAKRQEIDHAAGLWERFFSRARLTATPDPGNNPSSHETGTALGRSI